MGTSRPIHFGALCYTFVFSPLAWGYDLHPTVVVDDVHFVRRETTPPYARVYSGHISLTWRPVPGAIRYDYRRSPTSTPLIVYGTSIGLTSTFGPDRPDQPGTACGISYVGNFFTHLQVTVQCQMQETRDDEIRPIFTDGPGSWQNAAPSGAGFADYELIQLSIPIDGLTRYGTEPFGLVAAPIPDDLGNTFSLYWDDTGRGPQYQLWYTPIGGASVFVGECAWDGGNNEHWIFTSEDGDGNNKPDRFLGAYWVSNDNLERDRTDINRLFFSFDAASGLLTADGYDNDTFVRSVSRLADTQNPAFQEGAAKIARQIFGSNAPMTLKTTAYNDVNQDGLVNDFDRAVITVSLNKCVGDASYNPRADMNGSRCIDVDDLVLAGFKPQLSITMLTNQVRLSWPTEFAGFYVEFNSRLTNTGWNPVALTNPAFLSKTNSARFYRLKR